MKVTQEKPTFAPVTIILETQNEVDALYLTMRHAFVTGAIEKVVPNVRLSDLFEGLNPSASEWAHSDEAFRRLEDNLFRSFKKN